MIDFRPIIEQVEALLANGSEQSLTYAALECRLAIEKVCYDRLRMAHDYISHAHLQRWQPAAVVNTLMLEVDPYVCTTRSLSISREPVNSSSPVVLPNEEYLELGTEVGFDSKKLSSLWNALSNLALHAKLPRSKAETIPPYGDKERIRAKVSEALQELRRLSRSTMSLGAFGPEVSFTCACGTLNKRKLEQLKPGQMVFCVNPSCDESFAAHMSGEEISFERQFVTFECSCGVHTPLSFRTAQKMKTDAIHELPCTGCGEISRFLWQLMHAKPRTSDGEAVG